MHGAVTAKALTPTLSQREREKQVEETQNEMILCCNNCCIKNGREGKDHEAQHGARAFFDLWYEPEEKHVANLDENLKPGLECVVATRQRDEITFRWYIFVKEKPGTIDGNVVGCFMAIVSKFLVHTQKLRLRAYNQYSSIVPGTSISGRPSLDKRSALIIGIRIETNALLRASNKLFSLRKKFLWITPHENY